MDAYLGTWEYHHELADENEQKFLDDLKMDKEMVKKLLKSKPKVKVTKVGANLLLKMETVGGEFDSEYTIYLDGKDSVVQLPDGRKATGKYSLKDGAMRAENLKVENVPGISVNESMVVKDGWLIVTMVIPEEKLTTVANYKKL
ncbi:fatty acid-binding protein, liver-like [Tubulanus polymorphus]|uniref:fatty acid-binding protein, liver-like n=1 Tax=Tubulanus polymorphus TaxID=672921 RepID=UPI003DA2A2E5